MEDVAEQWVPGAALLSVVVAMLATRTAAYLSVMNEPKRLIGVDGKPVYGPRFRWDRRATLVTLSLVAGLAAVCGHSFASRDSSHAL